LLAGFVSDFDTLGDRQWLARAEKYDGIDTPSVEIYDGIDTHFSENLRRDRHVPKK